MQDVGIGIIGSGFAGRVHALAARMLGARLVGVVSSTPTSSEVAGTLLHAEQTFRSAAELIEHPAVDVVHVCTPNVLHVPLVEMALTHGKHVICEKPLATTSADAAKLVSLAERSGRETAVCFAYRYQTVAQEARARIQSGDLGAVRLLHGTYLQDWLLYETDSSWRTVAEIGGRSRAFADIGSHWCDLAEWITGHRITDVASVVSTVYDKRSRSAAGDGNSSQERDTYSVDTEDIACVVFRATGNVVGTLTVSQVSPGRKNRLWIEVDAAESSVVFDQENAEWLWLGGRLANRTIARNSSGASAQFPTNDLPPGHARGFVETFAELFADVYSSILNGSSRRFPSFADGLRSCMITDAVLSSASGRSWERIP